MNKEWIEENYVNGDITFSDLASMVGGRSAAYRMLKHFEIVKRKTRKRYDVDKEWLQKRYEVDLASIKSISEEIGCGVDFVKELCMRYSLKRGAKYIQSESFKLSQIGKSHSEESKLKMSKSKSQLDVGYTRWRRNGGNYIHRKIAEEILERKLKRSEVVHHIDMDKTNQHPSNLLVLETDSHTALHAAMRRNPTMDQKKWLKDSFFEFEELKSGTYTKSNTFERWAREIESVCALGSD